MCSDHSWCRQASCFTNRVKLLGGRKNGIILSQLLYSTQHLAIAAEEAHVEWGRWHRSERWERLNTVVGEAGKMLSPSWNAPSSCSRLALPPVCSVVLVRISLTPFVFVCLFVFVFATLLSFPNFRHLCTNRIFFFWGAFSHNLYPLINLILLSYITQFFYKPYPKQ